MHPESLDPKWPPSRNDGLPTLNLNFQFRLENRTFFFFLNNERADIGSLSFMKLIWDGNQRYFSRIRTIFHLVHWTHNPSYSMRQQNQGEFQLLSSNTPGFWMFSVYIENVAWTICEANWSFLSERPKERRKNWLR